MANDAATLEFAKWVLERNLGWIAAAEVKTGVIVALDTAMLGSLAAAFSGTDPNARTICDYLFPIIASATLGYAIVCASQAVVPSLTGPERSLIFFGRISDIETSAQYVSRFKQQDIGDHLDDCLAQIHRNAQVASAKFKCVQKGVRWSFLSIVPWVLALAALVRV